MFRSKFLHQLLVAFSYAVIVTIAGSNLRVEFLLFWLGLAAGTFILYFEPFISAYLSSPPTPLSQEARQILKAGKLKEVFNFALSHQEQEQPILHSALFQVALTALGFYVVTSTTTLFGSGLVLGMALHLISEEVAVRHDPQRLNRMLFWNIQREVSEKEQRIYLGIIFALFGLETLLLI